VIAEVAKAEAYAAKAEEAVEETVAGAEPVQAAAQTTDEPDHTEAIDGDTSSQPVGNAYAAEEIDEEPQFGGALNATTEQAADDARREIENDQNKTILSHSAYLGGDAPAATSAYTADDQPAGFPGAPSIAPGSVGVNEVESSDALHSAYAFNQAPAAEPVAPVSGSVGGGRVIQPLGDQSAPSDAVNSAYAAPEVSSEPAPAYIPTPEPSLEPVQSESIPQAPLEPTPVDLGLPLPPPIPDFSQVNAGAPAPALPLPPTEQPAILGDILAPEPQPQFQPLAAPEIQLPPLQQPEPQPVAADPGQFQIPGQQ
jgi:hypothetical protein